MNKNYIILAVLFIILAGGIFFLPEKENYKQITPEQLMWDMVQTSRYVTTDEVAAMIITGDPTLQLVDVRNEKDFFAYSLPGSENIPFDSIVSDDYRDYLGLEDMNMVFYSNDDILADQTWVIVKRLGYNNIYVMKGGLNEWINTIIRPEAPSESAPEVDWELYSSRKGASMYFTGAEITVAETDEGSPVMVQRKKKSGAAEGGC